MDKLNKYRLSSNQNSYLVLRRLLIKSKTLDELDTHKKQIVSANTDKYELASIIANKITGAWILVIIAAGFLGIFATHSSITVGLIIVWTLICVLINFKVESYLEFILKWEDLMECCSDMEQKISFREICMADCREFNDTELGKTYTVGTHSNAKFIELVDRLWANVKVGTIHQCTSDKENDIIFAKTLYTLNIIYNLGMKVNSWSDVVQANPDFANTVKFAIQLIYGEHTTSLDQFYLGQVIDGSYLDLWKNNRNKYDILIDFNKDALSEFKSLMETYVKWEATHPVHTNFQYDVFDTYETVELDAREVM